MEGWRLLIFLFVIGLMALLINVFFITAIFGVSIVWYAQLILFAILAIIDFTFFMMMSKVFGD